MQGVHAEAEPDPRQERFNTLWARVNDAATPAEFQAWTSLLSTAEQLVRTEGVGGWVRVRVGDLQGWWVRRGSWGSKAGGLVG